MSTAKSNKPQFVLKDAVSQITVLKQNLLKELAGIRKEKANLEKEAHALSYSKLNKIDALAVLQQGVDNLHKELIVRLKERLLSYAERGSNGQGFVVYQYQSIFDEANSSIVEYTCQLGNFKPWEHLFIVNHNELRELFAVVFDTILDDEWPVQKTVDGKEAVERLDEIKNRLTELELQENELVKEMQKVGINVS